MKKYLIKKLNQELEFLTEFNFNPIKSSDGPCFRKETPFGFQQISFFERFIDKPELYCTISIRINQVENVVNFYKCKNGIGQLKYAAESPTIAVDLGNVVNEEVKFWSDQNLTTQFRNYLTQYVIPFFEEYSSLDGVWKAINDNNLMTYIEPIGTFYSLIIGFLNQKETSSVIDHWNELNPSGGMIQLWAPLFSEVIPKISEHSALESL